MNNGLKYDIFISYRRATGANAARMMQLALTARGYSVFFDGASLLTGDNFSEVISSAIDSCEVLILMMTEGVLDQCMARFEVLRAIERKKRVVLVEPSDQNWRFPVNLPNELLKLKDEQVFKLDMGCFLDESIGEIENSRFPKGLRVRRRLSRTKESCDIFISYRRATGANAARMMQLALTARGYSVFLDFDSLKDGKFNEAIYSVIDSCEVFILMMTEGALDRCVNENDWVRREIALALEKKKHIVPVAPSDQSWGFPANLPRDLSAICDEQVSKLDMGSLSNESIDKIEAERFPEELRTRRRLRGDEESIENGPPIVSTIDEDTWVFLSHSHEDYDKVVQVRNLLEERKFRPLMFFLKCLEEDGEIDALIKREIDSRSRFVLCDSKSARASRWVKEEVAYIKSKNRVLEVIDLDSLELGEIDAKLRAFEQRLRFTVFFSKSRQSEVGQVFRKLQAYGFRVQWAVLDEKCDVFQCRETLISLSRLGCVALYPDGQCEQFCAALTKDLPAEHSVLVVSLGNDLDLYDLIDRMGHEDAMILARFANSKSRMELLECVAYGGHPRLKLALGYMFERGEHGVEMDLQKALTYFKDVDNQDGISTGDDVKRIKEKIAAASGKETDGESAVRCPWKGLDGEAWGELLCVLPQFADRCPWEKLDGRTWSRILCAQPQFAGQCRWEKLSSKDWNDLLVVQPQFADRCPWEKLESSDWGELLSAQPQFAENCPWEKLDISTWSRILCDQEQFILRCPWDRLAGKDWSELLSIQPWFVDRCPVEKLNDEDWDKLLIEQPRLAEWRGRKGDGGKKGAE